jgi:hypothetical protein
MIPDEFVKEYEDAGGTVVQLDMSAGGVNFVREEGGGSLALKSIKIWPTTYIKYDVVSFKDLYYDAFPDFEGYTKIVAHIPYIGEVPIPTNLVMGGRMQITIACDAQNGNLTAWIWTEDKDEQSDYTIIATGNCSYPIPLASMSSDPSNFGKVATGVIAAIGGLASIAAAPVTGGASLAVAGGTAIAAGSVSAISGAYGMREQKDTTIKFDNGGALSLMSDPRCWIEVTRPVWVEPENYQALYGLPAYTGRTIMECPQKDNPEATQPFEGFLVIDAIDLTGIDGPTSEEKEMIEAELSKGIFVNYDKIQ